MKLSRILTILSLFLVTAAQAQFGNKKKADIEKFKDSRMVVVLYADSAYNASIKAAVEKYWSFNGGYIFAPDTALKAYQKGDFSFLTFSKAKGTKIKAKLGSSDPDFNGLLVLNKYRKKGTEEEIIAKAYCSNTIDTSDWRPELIRGVQLLNNYFNVAIEAAGEKEMSESYLINNYPTDKSMLGNKRLLIEGRLLELKGKEDAATLLDGEVEEITDQDEIYKAIINQDAGIMYYYFSNDEKSCNKLVVSAEGSQLLYFGREDVNKCKCNSGDFKKMKASRDKASR